MLGAGRNWVHCAPRCSKNEKAEVVKTLNLKSQLDFNLKYQRNLQQFFHLFWSSFSVLVLCSEIKDCFLRFEALSLEWIIKSQSPQISQELFMGKLLAQESIKEDLLGKWFRRTGQRDNGSRWKYPLLIPKLWQTQASIIIDNFQDGLENILVILCWDGQVFREWNKNSKWSWWFGVVVWDEYSFKENILSLLFGNILWLLFRKRLWYNIG